MKGLLTFLLVWGGAILKGLSRLFGQGPEKAERVKLKKELVKTRLELDAQTDETNISESIKNVREAKTDQEFVERWKKAQAEEPKGHE